MQNLNCETYVDSPAPETAPMEAAPALSGEVVTELLAVCQLIADQSRELLLPKSTCLRLYAVLHAARGRIWSN